MRFPIYFGIGIFTLGIVLLGLFTPDKHKEQKTTKVQDTLYSFQHDISPLLQSKCNPCHYPGGKMFKKLPFTDYKTVASLGKKLNTRLKEKQQQAMINGWVESGEREK